MTEEKEEIRDKRIDIRLSATEKKHWQRAARKLGMKLSDLVRKKINEFLKTA